MTTPTPPAGPAPGQPDPNAQPPAGDPNAGPPAPPPGAPGGDPQQGTQPPAGNRVEDLPDWAQRIIRDTRAEAAQNRTGKQTAEQQAAEAKRVVDAINAALNPGAAADPAKLAEQLAAQQTENRQLRVDQALNAALATHQADPTLTRAVLASGGQLGQLDPSAADFAQQLDAAVKAAVEANPKLKASSTPARSGAPFTGGSGGDAQQVTEEQLKTMTPEQIVDAQKKGRLRSLLG